MKNSVQAGEGVKEIYVFWVNHENNNSSTTDSKSCKAEEDKSLRDGYALGLQGEKKQCNLFSLQRSS